MSERVSDPADAGAVVPAGNLHAPLWLLALVTFSGTLAMHIFVPALPNAGDSLHASPSSMQMTISLYILGLAFGQLFYGPLADRFGRRPVLIAGLSIYTVAGLAASLAPEVNSLIVARLFQALGGCAGLVLGRTVVRDTSAPHETARRLAMMNMMVTVGPTVAPLIGTALATTLGWRSIFYCLFALGLTGLFLTWRLLPETNLRGAKLSGPALAKNYRQLLTSPAFICYAVGGGCATTAVYGFIASAPFIFVHQLGRPVHESGLYIAGLVSGIWLGTLLTSRLIARMSVETLLVRSNALAAAAAFAFLGCVLTGHLSVITTMTCMFVYTVGIGMSAPAALTQAMSINPNVIGSASGLYGFSQMSVGAICTALVTLTTNPALGAALVLAGAGLVSQIGFQIASRTQRRLLTS